MLRKMSFGLYRVFAVLFLSALVMSCGGAGGSSNMSDPTYTLSGTVTGVVQQGVMITLSGPGIVSTTTSTGGTYSFAGLANGYYTVTASRVTYAFSPSVQIVPINYANAVAADFVSTDAYSILGTVTSGGIGSHPGGVTMTLTGSTLSAPVTTTTDSVGTYTFNKIVSNGTYTLTPTKSSTRTVCGGLNGPGFTVTETTTFSPTEQSITINNADVTAVDFVGTFHRWSGVCPL